jgi:hypothetical protein
LLVAFAAGTLHASAAQQSESAVSLAEKFILAQFVPQLGQYDQKLTLGQAECPSAADFTDGKIVNCTLFVDAVPLQIGLTYSDEKKTYVFAPSSFFEMDRLEMLEQATILSDYGVSVEMQCGARSLPGGSERTVLCFQSGWNEVAGVNRDGHRPAQSR